MSNLIEPISKLNFEEIYVGLEKKFQVQLDEKLLDQFAQVCGDFNPLHMSDSYAQKTKFGQRIVHGMLLASFFSRLVGMHLPGQKALYLSQNLQFKKPAFIGDQIEVVGKVVHLNKSIKLITLKNIISNQNQDILVTGEAKVMFLD